MHVSDEDVCSDIAYSMYATRHGMTEDQVAQLWKSLGLYIASCLKCGKGVLLPALGTFYPPSQKAGYRPTQPVNGSPCFQLQDKVFGAVSQEAARAARKGTIAQLNYNRIGAGLPFHRAVVQRLIRELLAKLGSHILCNQLLQVHLHPVGTFIRRRGGRFRFQFNEGLLAYLAGDAEAIELEKLISSAQQQQQQPPSRPQTAWAPGKVPDHISQPPGTPKSQRQPSPTQSVYPEANLAAQAAYSPVPGINAVQQSQQVPLSGVVHGMHASATAPMTPRSRGIATLRALCGAADWARNGRVARLQMERWLNGECRALTSQLPATAIFDLLQTHAYGRSGSSVKYAPLLDALSAQVKQLHWEEASGLRQASVIPAHPSGNVQLPGSPTASQLYGMGSYQQNLRPHVFQPPAPGTWQGHPAVYPPQYSGVAAAAPDLADKEPFPYFMQCDLAPRNRADCDAFNRFHFQRLAAVRQASGGGVTPKVGNEPLTVYEAEYTKQVVRNRSASPLGRNENRPLSAVPIGHRDLSPGAAPPGFRPATAQPLVSRQRSMSVAPDGMYPTHGDMPPPTVPEYHGYGGRLSAPPVPNHTIPGAAHGLDACMHPQMHMQRLSPDLHMIRQPAAAHAAPQTVPCSPVHGQPTPGPDVLHADKHVSFQPAAASPQPGLGKSENAQQHTAAQGSFHADRTASPSHHPAVAMPAHTNAPDIQQAGASITLRGDAPMPPSAHTNAAVPNTNRSPSPMNQVRADQVPQNQRAQQNHLFAAPDEVGEKLAASGLGEPVVQPRSRGRSPVRADADIGDENAHPWNHRDSSSPVRTTRDPSPVKQLLTWNAPIQEYKCPRSQYGPRPETAESVRKSYELQIQQRDALHEAYAQAESKWPYQPIHHPEARYAYFTGPRYIGPKHVQKKCTSNRL